MINNQTEHSYFIPLISYSTDENETPLPYTEPVLKTPHAFYKKTKLSFTTNLYVASLTVIGLLVIFRFVQKSR